MRSLLVVCALVGFAASFSDEAWEAYKLKYNKEYETEVEDAVRRRIVEANAERIAQHNLEADLGLYTWTEALNEFQDMTHDEYKATLLTVVPPHDESSEENVEVEILPGTPATQNWGSQGRVTSVKNQGQCGSCWSFSAAAGLEGCWAAAHSLNSLSEQQLVSCDTYDDGCNGGWYTNAWMYLQKYGGSISYSNYPYVSGNGVVPSCQENGKPIAATVKSWTNCVKGSYSSLLNTVGNTGPTSVAINASLQSFNSYSSGVYAPTNCNPNDLDHAVLVTGYNVDNGVEYWIIKNSWGTGWGQKGYMWMKRGVNMCGILNGPPSIVNC